MKGVKLAVTGFSDFAAATIAAALVVEDGPAQPG
jgi:hypothetical protein